MAPKSGVSGEDLSPLSLAIQVAEAASKGRGDAWVAPSSLLWTGFLLGKKQSLSKPAVLEILTTARVIEDWHEDFGSVLWWTCPVSEPPYVGCPLSSD